MWKSSVKQLQWWDSNVWVIASQASETGMRDESRLASVVLRKVRGSWKTLFELGEASRGWCLPGCKCFDSEEATQNRNAEQQCHSQKPVCTCTTLNQLFNWVNGCRKCCSKKVVSSFTARGTCMLWLQLSACGTRYGYHMMIIVYMYVQMIRILFIDSADQNVTLGYPYFTDITRSLDPAEQC